MRQRARPQTPSVVHRVPWRADFQSVSESQSRALAAGDVYELRCAINAGPHIFQVSLPRMTAGFVSRTLHAVAGPAAKSGGRVEYPIALDDADLRAVAADITVGLPLAFASLVVAERLPATAAHQEYHADGTASIAGEVVHVIVYLSDVLRREDGPVEFECCGPVLGPVGTAVAYAPSAMHRGRARTTNGDPRVALALAFTAGKARITTIGSAAEALGRRLTSAAGVACVVNANCASDDCGAGFCCTTTAGADCSACSASNGTCMTCATTSANYVSSGICKAKLATGATCVNSGDCVSTANQCSSPAACLGGRCCNMSIPQCSSCDNRGSCVGCNAGFWLQQLVVSGQSILNCLPALADGTPCAGANAICFSGACRAGVCCSVAAAANSNCLSCSLSSGGGCSSCTSGWAAIGGVCVANGCSASAWSAWSRCATCVSGAVATRTRDVYSGPCENSAVQPCRPCAAQYARATFSAAFDLPMYSFDNNQTLVDAVTAAVAVLPRPPVAPSSVVVENIEFVSARARAMSLSGFMFTVRVDLSASADAGAATDAIRSGVAGGQLAIALRAGGLPVASGSITLVSASSVPPPATPISVLPFVMVNTVIGGVLGSFVVCLCCAGVYISCRNVARRRVSERQKAKGAAGGHRGGVVVHSDPMTLNPMPGARLGRDGDGGDGGSAPNTHVVYAVEQRRLLEEVERRVGAGAAEASRKQQAEDAAEAARKQQAGVAAALRAREPTDSRAQQPERDVQRQQAQSVEEKPDPTVVARQQTQQRMLLQEQQLGRGHASGSAGATGAVGAVALKGQAGAAAGAAVSAAGARPVIMGAPRAAVGVMVGVPRTAGVTAGTPRTVGVSVGTPRTVDGVPRAFATALPIASAAVGTPVAAAAAAAAAVGADAPAMAVPRAAHIVQGVPRSRGGGVARFAGEVRRVEAANTVTRAFQGPPADAE